MKIWLLIVNLGGIAQIYLCFTHNQQLRRTLIKQKSPVQVLLLLLSKGKAMILLISNVFPLLHRLPRTPAYVETLFIAAYLNWIRASLYQLRFSKPTTPLQQLGPKSFEQVIRHTCTTKWSFLYYQSLLRCKGGLCSGLDLSLEEREPILLAAKKRLQISQLKNQIPSLWISFDLSSFPSSVFDPEWSKVCFYLVKKCVTC